MKAFLLIGGLVIISIAVNAQTYTIPAGTYSSGTYSDIGYTQTILQGNRARSGSVRFNHYTPIFITSDKSWITQVYSAFPTGTPGTNADYFLYQGRSEIQGIGGGTLVFDTLYLNNGAGNLFYLNNRNNASSEYFNPAGGAFIYSSVFFNNGITATNRQYPVTGALVFISNAGYTGGLTDAQHVDGFVSEANLNFGTPLGHDGNFTYPVGNATSVYQLNRTGTFDDFENTITVGWVDGDPEFTSDPTGSINHATAAYRGAGINAISRVGFWDWHVQQIEQTAITPRSLPNAQAITVSIPNFSYIPGLSASDLRLVGFNTATSKWENLSGSTGASGLTKGSTLAGTIPANTTIVALAVGSVNTIPLVNPFAPGGVGFNTMQLWTRADIGVITSGTSVSQWTNQAPVSMTTQASKTANSNVTLSDEGNNALNYNPTLTFTGADNEVLSGTFAANPSNPAMLFAVTKRATTPDVALSNPYSLGPDGGAGIAYNNNSYAVDRSGGVCAPTADVRGIPSLVRIDYDQASSTTGATSALNGLVTTTGACDGTGVSASNGTFQIGGRTYSSQASRVFAGQIAEVIHFNVNNFPNTTADINKVESYLALKYGITLDNSANGTSGGNYTSSAGTTIWNAGSAPAYHNNVIGIGRDNSSGLLQKQSHTTDDSARIYVGTLQTSNATNTGTIDSDGSFVVAGDNGGYMFNNGSTEYPQDLGIVARIDREWKITNTNFNGTFSMDIKVKPTNINPLHLKILVDDDGDFQDAQVFSPEIYYINEAAIISGITTTMIPAGTTRYITLMSVNNQTPLPVELTSFTARPQGTAVQLNWTTATEQNNAFFGVERSADGSNWQQIGKVDGAGNSSQPLSYVYTDQQPLNGTSYYRLKQTDYNGTFKYSPVEVVRLQNGNPTLRVYPNPVGQEVTIQTSKVVVQVNLLSTNGRTVLRHAPSRVAGGTFSINVHSVQSGIYLLQVVNKDGTTDVIKLIKQ